MYTLYIHLCPWCSNFHGMDDHKHHQLWIHIPSDPHSMPLRQRCLGPGMVLGFAFYACSTGFAWKLAGGIIAHELPQEMGTGTNGANGGKTQVLRCFNGTINHLHIICYMIMCFIAMLDYPRVYFFATFMTTVSYSWKLWVTNSAWCIPWLCHSVLAWNVLKSSHDIPGDFLLTRNLGCPEPLANWGCNKNWPSSAWSHGPQELADFYVFVNKARAPHYTLGATKMEVCNHRWKSSSLCGCSGR